MTRRRAFWWWSYSRYWDTAVLGYGRDGEEITSGETVTDDKGEYTIDVPLTMKESADPVFYTFVVTADVTDSAGETRTGQLSLPLGNRKTVLTVDLQEKILANEHPQTTIHLLNAAGQDIDAKARYQTYRAQKEWDTAKTSYEAGLNYFFSKNLELHFEYARVNDRSIEIANESKHDYNLVDVELDFRF